MTSKPQISSPVQLNEGKIEGLSDFANLLIEYGVFFRWIFFKNRPRGNLLLARSFLIVGFYSLLFFQFHHDFELVLMGIDVDPVLLLSGAVVVGYWSMLSAFAHKSSACAGMFLEMVKSRDRGQKNSEKLILNSLALELLTMDLWAHRQYRQIFAMGLEAAILHAYEHPGSLRGKAATLTKTELFELINRGGLQAKEAREFLDQYELMLLS